MKIEYEVTTDQEVYQKEIKSYGLALPKKEANKEFYVALEPKMYR